MATAFRRHRGRGRGRGISRGDTLVATLDAAEREVVATLMLQTRELVAPPEPVHPPVSEPVDAPVGEPQPPADEPQKPDPPDEFDELMATLGIDATEEQVDARAGAAAAEQRDPALNRLIPPANREDPAAAAEFRRLTEHGLRQRKADNLTVAIDALAAAGPAKDRVVLDPEQAHAFLIALVDVRLVLGERLGLRTDEDADALHGYLAGATLEDPRATMAAYYDFMTWLQESLTQALMR